jgi:hypothetical protein
MPRALLDPTRMAKAAADSAAAAWLAHRKVCFTCAASLRSSNPAGACDPGWELWKAARRTGAQLDTARSAAAAAAAGQVTLF